MRSSRDLIHRCPTEFTAGVYDTIVAAGARFGLAHAGYHALDSLRIEKACRHWGHDITDEDTPLEAGLSFAVKFDKPGGFIGREALLRDREAGPAKRLRQFRLQDLGRCSITTNRSGTRTRWSVTSPPALTATPSGAPSALAMSTRPRRQTRQRRASASRWPGTAFRRRFRQGRCTTPGTGASAADAMLAPPNALLRSAPGPSRTPIRCARVSMFERGASQAGSGHTKSGRRPS